LFSFYTLQTTWFGILKNAVNIRKTSWITLKLTLVFIENISFLVYWLKSPSVLAEHTKHAGHMIYIAIESCAGWHKRKKKKKKILQISVQLSQRVAAFKQQPTGFAEAQR